MPRTFEGTGSADVDLEPFWGTSPSPPSGGKKGLALQGSSLHLCCPRAEGAGACPLPPPPPPRPVPAPPAVLHGGVWPLPLLPEEEEGGRPVTVPPPLPAGSGPPGSGGPLDGDRRPSP